MCKLQGAHLKIKGSNFVVYFSILVLNEGMGKEFMKVTYRKCYLTYATNKQVDVMMRLTGDIHKVTKNGKTLQLPL